MQWKEKDLLGKENIAWSDRLRTIGCLHPSNFAAIGTGTSGKLMVSHSGDAAFPAFPVPDKIQERRNTLGCSGWQWFPVLGVLSPLRAFLQQRHSVRIFSHWFRAREKEKD